MLEKGNEALRVLVVEDLEDEAEIVELELRRSGFDVVSRRVATEADFLEAVKSLPDVILADATLPRFSALQALQRLHELELEIPFVVVAGRMDEERAAECTREGATDSLDRDGLARLGAIVRRALAEKRQRDEIRRLASELKHAEQELHRLESRLLSTQRMEAVGHLAGGVAHDFNNIITVISGQCHLLLSHGSLETPARSRVEEIDRAAERAAALTRQLLAFSRRQVLQPSVLDLNAVIEEMNQMLVRVLGEDIVIETELASDLGRVKADRSQIEQVVINLAVNARDAMPRGGKLTLRTSNVEVGEERALCFEGLRLGAYVLLSVSDRGTGMDQNILSRIFEPFYTTKELGRGTGLGLSTVYGIVKQSEGGIYVRSAPGEGSTFDVLLPIVNEPLSVVQQDPAAPARGEGTILLVEDDGALRRLAREVLEAFGYTVLESAGGHEALGRIERQNGGVDLVLTDLVMPGMRGDEFILLLSARYPDIKVLYTSGHVDGPLETPGSRRRREFIQKPFKSEELVRKVNELVRVRR